MYALKVIASLNCKILKQQVWEKMDLVFLLETKELDEQAKLKV